MLRVLRLRALRRDQRGLSTVEYTVLLVLILAGAITLWKDLGSSLKKQLGGGVKAISGMNSGSGGAAGGL